MQETEPRQVSRDHFIKQYLSIAKQILSDTLPELSTEVEMMKRAQSVSCLICKKLNDAVGVFECDCGKPFRVC